MAKQRLLAFPYISELGYREKIDEYKMNLMLRSIEESVLRAILRGSESKETLDELKLGVETSYNALASHASSIMSYDNICRNSPDTLFCTSFDTVTGGHTDRVAGITTLPWDSNRNWTKIPRYDSDNDGISDTVSPSVGILVDDTLRPTDNEVYKALNRSNKSFWIESATNGEHDIEIRLPPALNKRFNYIELVPFPLFGMEIKTITYDDSLSVPKTIYDKNNKQYRFYDNTGPLVMHLSPKETNGTFKITVDVKHEALGFSNIDIAMIDYYDDPQTIYMKIENMPSRAVTTTYDFDSIDIDFYVNGTDINYQDYISEVAITNGMTSGADRITINNINTGTKNLIGESLELTTDQDAYVKFVMKEKNTTTPVIRGCKIELA